MENRSSRFAFMDIIMTRLRVWRSWKKLKRLAVSATYEDHATGERVNDFCKMLAGLYWRPSCRRELANSLLSPLPLGSQDGVRQFSASNVAARVETDDGGASL